MRVTGIDACRRGWVAVSLETSGPVRLASVEVFGSLASVLAEGQATVVGIDMPLGLLESGWREADRVARGLLGPRRSSVFTIPPAAVWAEASYQAANQRCHPGARDHDPLLTLAFAKTGTRGTPIQFAEHAWAAF